MTRHRRPDRWTARVMLADASASSTRGARWLRRQGADPAGRPQDAGRSAWDRMAALPAFVDWPEPDRRRLGIVAALIDARPAIDRTLDGARLAPLAALVGEPLFDALCALPSGVGHPASPLPAPAACMARGSQLLDESLSVPAPAIVTAMALIEGDASC